MSSLVRRMVLKRMEENKEIVPDRFLGYNKEGKKLYGYPLFTKREGPKPVRRVKKNPIPKALRRSKKTKKWFAKRAKEKTLGQA